ncbi:uncharacterized protein AMSG_00282 [Thecamonas trahens ATCC 50062]|uniref:Uncharacterized protein n=1 Tax=Thecamonas trahens ATCC 50062 TaxID=461836 RepID=A0A0L0D4D6_THETB|nr:hypothetical protein AMSG_00282 [Thecamonas trahens ATCC 50062]KNC46163.1 hypothetical protein AMSG_00282 [Thecamonas trahens ATCC 50062]|eukprot:XP_013763139.1 hypothetical protein AMSG_00282 [Thecamonas trahens ATCC 50062]
MTTLPPLDTTPQRQPLSPPLSSPLLTPSAVLPVLLPHARTQLADEADEHAASAGQGPLPVPPSHPGPSHPPLPAHRRRFKASRNMAVITALVEREAARERASWPSKPAGPGHSGVTAAPAPPPALPPPKSRIPEEFHLYSPVEDEINALGTSILAFPTSAPSSRAEVLHLTSVLDAMLDRLPNTAAADRPPSEVYAEMEVWDIVFSEIVRQVHVHCAERGVLLERVRNRYVSLFTGTSSLHAALETEVADLRNRNVALAAAHAALVSGEAARDAARAAKYAALEEAKEAELMRTELALATEREAALALRARVEAAETSLVRITTTEPPELRALRAQLATLEAERDANFDAVQAAREALNKLKDELADATAQLAAAAAVRDSATSVSVQTEAGYVDFRTQLLSEDDAEELRSHIARLVADKEEFARQRILCEKAAASADPSRAGTPAAVLNEELAARVEAINESKAFYRRTFDSLEVLGEFAARARARTVEMDKPMGAQVVLPPVDDVDHDAILVKGLVQNDDNWLQLFELARFEDVDNMDEYIVQKLRAVARRVREAVAYGDGESPEDAAAADILGPEGPTLPRTESLKDRYLSRHASLPQVETSTSVAVQTPPEMLMSGMGAILAASSSTASLHPAASSGMLTTSVSTAVQCSLIAAEDVAFDSDHHAPPPRLRRDFSFATRQPSGLELVRDAATSSSNTHLAASSSRDLPRFARSAPASPAPPPQLQRAASGDTTIHSWHDDDDDQLPAKMTQATDELVATLTSSIIPSLAQLAESKPPPQPATAATPLSPETLPETSPETSPASGNDSTPPSSRMQLAEDPDAYAAAAESVVSSAHALLTSTAATDVRQLGDAQVHALRAKVAKVSSLAVRVQQSVSGADAVGLRPSASLAVPSTTRRASMVEPGSPTHPALDPQPRRSKSRTRLRRSRGSSDTKASSSGSRKSPAQQRLDARMARYDIETADVAVLAKPATRQRETQTRRLSTSSALASDSDASLASDGRDSTTPSTAKSAGRSRTVNKKRMLGLARDMATQTPSGGGKPDSVSVSVQCHIESWLEEKQMIADDKAKAAAKATAAEAATAAAVGSPTSSPRRGSIRGGNRRRRGSGASVARRKPRSGPDADSAARRATVDVGVQWEHPNPDEEVNEKSFKTRVTEYLADHQISKAVRLAGEADDDDDDDDDDDALAAQLESLNPLSVLAETEAVEMDTSVEDSSASSQPLSTAAAAHPPQSPRGDAGDQGTPSSRRKRRRRRSPNPEAATESPAADSETAASPQTPREQPRHSRRKSGASPWARVASRLSPLKSKTARKRLRRFRARNRMLVEIFAQNLNQTPKHLHWLLRIVRKVYADKAVADALLDKASLPHATLPEFVYRFLKSKYGTSTLVSRNLGAVIVTAQHFRKGNLEIDTFAKFMEEVWSVKALDKYLEARQLAVELQVGIAYFRPSQRTSGKQYVCLLRARAVAERVLGERSAAAAAPFWARVEARAREATEDDIAVTRSSTWLAHNRGIPASYVFRKVRLHEFLFMLVEEFILLVSAFRKRVPEAFHAFANVHSAANALPGTVSRAQFGAVLDELGVRAAVTAAPGGSSRLGLMRCCTLTRHDRAWLTSRASAPCATAWLTSRLHGATRLFRSTATSTPSWSPKRRKASCSRSSTSTGGSSTCCLRSTVRSSSSTPGPGKGTRRFRSCARCWRRLLSRARLRARGPQSCIASCSTSRWRSLSTCTSR